MRNIRFATLAKIIIPLFLICAAVVLVSFVYYQSAMYQENDFLNSTIESFGVVLAPHVAARLAEVQTRSAMLYIVLTCVIGVFLLIALLSLFMITYKLVPIRNIISVATGMAKGDENEKNLTIPKDELGDLTIELAYLIKINDKNLAILEDALEKANAASKAKGDFLSNMSHEIRTPINAIIGMTNIAKSAYRIERKDYALEKIGDASNHLLGIVNDILDMSKIEAEKLELSKEAFDFEEMLKKAINIVNYRAVEKHQVLSVYIDENIPRKIISDDQRLAQVITNLLSNAVKFTSENGKIDLYTKLLSDEDGICEIRFDVTDNGVGISEDQQHKLFNPFEQAESSTTRKYGGTGLGLTIAKRIVELMDGEISVVSVLGEGSTFTFTIKAEIAEDMECDSHMLKENVDTDNVRILVVDDDEDILEYLVDITKRFNIACDVFANGIEAIEHVKKGNIYDMCFIDWKMPNLNGIELAREIKGIDSDKSVIIMISSVEWQDIADEAGEAGIDKFLPKPIFPSNIRDCINQYLNIDMLYIADNDIPESENCFSGYRALLAEDVEINREIVLAMLESTLLEIECAENGEEAVRMFIQSPEKYDIIFMDLQMPEMDGLDATRKIRAYDCEKAKTIPIIAMTANVFKEDVENCLAAGMDDHIGKPLDFDLVMKMLRNYLLKQKPASNR